MSGSAEDAPKVVFPPPNSGYVLPPYTAGVNEHTNGNIIHRTDIVFQLTGADAVPFQSDKQQILGSVLHTLLQNYNLMSVALSDYEVRMACTSPAFNMTACTTCRHRCLDACRCLICTQYC